MSNSTTLKGHYTTNTPAPAVLDTVAHSPENTPAAAAAAGTPVGQHMPVGPAAGLELVGGIGSAVAVAAGASSAAFLLETCPSSGSVVASSVRQFAVAGLVVEYGRVQQQKKKSWYRA